MMAVSLENVLRSRIANTIVLAAMAYGITSTLRYVLKSAPGSFVTGSPLKTLLPNLSEQAKAQLPYPSDALPGARDVPSPYGSIRVYEWGPESGRKVLLVHGISTPCVSLRDIAHVLVENGCRVMLFDLFGRGYSDNPDDLPQDSRLFCTQILIALASSPLSWTGRASGKFALIGYSLGGGIAASFTSHFPGLVSSLTLITPSGLLRPNRVSLRTLFLYSQGILPEPLLKYLVRERLRSSLVPASSPQSTNSDTRLTEPGEVPEYESPAIDASSGKLTALNVADVVRFQVDYHRGFVQAYMSSMRYGPIMTEHATWKRVGQTLSKKNKETKENNVSDTGLSPGKVLIICANEDTSIVSSELVPDAIAALEGNVEFRHFDAGHEIPMSKSREVAKAIWELWSG